MELKVLEWTFFRECKVSKDIENILVDGESATVVYKTIRDLAVFTNKRLIVKDKQGITGHKSEIFSLPYKSIIMWSIENAGKIVDLDYDKYIAYMGRQKTPGAFDNVDLSTGENNEFGDETTDNKHFTEYMLEHSTVNGTMADKKIIKMMNPMNYIESSKVKYWRIRHGAVDKDTSLAIPAILAIKLENLGKKVDFASPWATPHSGDYDLDELFRWMDKVVAEGK